MNKAITSLLLIGLAGYGGVVLGATPACSALAISTISSTPSGNISGNNCNNNTGISAVCTGLTSLNGAGADIYGLTIGTNYSNVQITVSPPNADWNPGIYLMPSSANACGGTGQPCKVSTQSVTATSTSGTLPTGLTAGTYYIVVADAGSDSPGCGAYNLSVSGTLPVKLQKFSVN